MSNTNFLALEYALGLLNDTEKQAIERTAAFEKELTEWQLKLSILNKKAPLKKQSAKKIWQNINSHIRSQIKQQHKNNISNTWLNSWRWTLSGFGALSLLLSIALFNHTANAQLGWDIDTNLSAQQLLITTTTHKHTNKNTVCTLWVKKDGKTLFIGYMPETGKKTLGINAKMQSMITGGEMIISFENKQNPASLPTVIDYQQKWL